MLIFLLFFEHSKHVLEFVIQVCLECSSHHLLALFPHFKFLLKSYFIREVFLEYTVYIRPSPFIFFILLSNNHHLMCHLLLSSFLSCLVIQLYENGYQPTADI